MSFMSAVSATPGALGSRAGRAGCQQAGGDPLARQWHARSYSAWRRRRPPGPGGVDPSSCSTAATAADARRLCPERGISTPT